MTSLVLTPLGEVWDTDGLARPRSTAALEREAERLRRMPRPTTDDLLRLGVLEDEIIAAYLALTERSLTRQEKKATGVGGPPSQDELAQIVTGLDECEFVAHLSRRPDDAILGREGDLHDCVIHRYLVGRWGARPADVAVRLDSVLVRGDWVELDRIVLLPPWAARISRLTTHCQGVFQPVPGQRIRARWLRRALSRPSGTNSAITPPVRPIIPEQAADRRRE